MTEEQREVKVNGSRRTVLACILAFVDHYGRLGWYIAFVSSLGVILDFIQLLVH